MVSGSSASWFYKISAQSSRELSPGDSLGTSKRGSLSVFVRFFSYGSKISLLRSSISSSSIGDSCCAAAEALSLLILIKSPPNRAFRESGKEDMSAN